MSHTMTLELLLCITGTYVLSLEPIFKVLCVNMFMCNLNLSSLKGKLTPCLHGFACMCSQLAALYLQFKCVKSPCVTESPYDELSFCW